PAPATAAKCIARYSAAASYFSRGWRLATRFPGRVVDRPACWWRIRRAARPTAASRARHNRQTTAFETHNGRSISTAGTALNALSRTFSVGRCKQPSCWKPASSDVSETELSRHTGCSPSDREADHEAARVDAPAGRRGDQLAPRPTRAAEGDAGDRLPRHDLPRPGFIDFGRVPPGTQ